MECFHCHRDIPTMRKGRCTYCGAPIPADQQLSANQLTAIDELDKAQEQQHDSTMKTINSIQILPTSPDGQIRDGGFCIGED